MRARLRRRSARRELRGTGAEMHLAPTLPSVTVRSVSMTDSFLSKVGVSLRKLMTTCTIFVTAWRSWPCFLDSSSTCSLSRPQSPASLASVTMATRTREVDARSDAYSVSPRAATVPSRYLASLLLEQEQHLNGRLHIALKHVSPARCGAELPTLAKSWA